MSEVSWPQGSHGQVMEDAGTPVCRVYWGSHSCGLIRGHKAHHICDCECDDHPDPDSGCVCAYPYYGWMTRFYGEDARQRPVRRFLYLVRHRMVCNTPASPRPLKDRRPWKACTHE